ncbi:MAG: non-canonical purine NTP pyrophosphatase, partial [Planctomicrobium sp.]|nr:non-canonical purine NTP pyrophosphatase [Planctomicrobium sp.]
ATCRGRIIFDAKGTNGFGYDPHFQIREYQKTFGEFNPIVKQQISHRAKAFERLLPRLLKVLSEVH